MKFPQFSQISLIKKARFSTRAFVVGAILSITFFLLLVDVFKTYTSSVAILVIPKSQVTAINEHQIVGNMLQFPKLLSFYDRMLELNSDVRDPASGLSEDKRKSSWNHMLSIRLAKDKGSVINISITTPRQADSELLAKKTARTLFDVTGNYYNIKTDLDLRIIDGPITSSQIPYWYFLLLVSLAAGFGLAMMLGLLIMGKELGEDDEAEVEERKPWFDFKRFTNASNEQQKNALDKLYVDEQNQMPFAPENEDDSAHLDENYLQAFEQDLKIKEMKRLTKQIEPDKYPNFPEMPVAHEMKASAPDNLPIADSSFLEMFSAPAEPAAQKPEIVEEKIIEIPEPKGEPSPEDLKKRLNELLKGKI